METLINRMVSQIHDKLPERIMCVFQDLDPIQGHPLARKPESLLLLLLFMIRTLEG